MRSYIIFLIISSSLLCAAASAFDNIPRLAPFPRTKKGRPQSTRHSDQASLKTYYFTQTLDHFNYLDDSYTTFQQRYMVDFTHWGGGNSSSPILAYLGAESDLDDDIPSIGFLRDHAPQFNALIIYIEHRYYGESVPFGSWEDAMKNSTRGYLNSAQAIADYADVLLHVKKNLSAQHSPIIVIGGSYGGMLASWFRLKYPHVALGALASSAPILYFDGVAPEAGYYYIITKDFKETSESCYQTIRQSWSEIDKVAKEPDGLSILSDKFKTCNKLSSTFELKSFLESKYSLVAQYNFPLVGIVCKVIDGAAAEAKKIDILHRIFEGLVAASSGNDSCYDMRSEFNQPTTEASLNWKWQTCSEMVMPIGCDRSADMFPLAPFDMGKFANDCRSSYGVLPRPHWITTYYGGYDLKLILQRFGSNIIFSNGLKDPYSSGGVLESISDNLVAVSTVNGSHCMDILSERSSDPEWLVVQRNTEVKIIQGWIAEYYTDLRSGGVIEVTSRGLYNLAPILCIFFLWPA